MLIATAGHIDHGKTALVRALTGVETDRLPEEKARGISIDLGFAYWPQEDGHTIGFIDVPGHERFVRTMLAGVSGADFALLVIAADDGIMPQTREHLAILDLLGFTRGAVALTKADKAGAARIAALAGEIEVLLAPTGLSGAPVFPVCAPSGEGLPALAGALQTAADMAAPPKPGAFRMAIDRAFSVTGAGTVVTGTVLAGSAALGEVLHLAPRGLAARVRGIESVGRKAERIGAGERCALALAGVDLGEVGRGDWLLAPEIAATTTRLAVRVRALTGLPRPLRHDLPVTVHVGTAAVPARLLVPRGGSIEAGAEALAMLVTERPVHAANAARMVLRDAGDRALLGGARVLDPFPPRRAIPGVTQALERHDPAAALAALLALPGHAPRLDWFARAFALPREAAVALVPGTAALGARDPVLLSAVQLADVEAAACEALARHHAAHPESGGMTRRELGTALGGWLPAEAVDALVRRLAEAGRAALAGTLVRLPGHEPAFAPAEVAMWQALGEWLDGQPPRTVTAAETAQALGLAEGAARALLYRRRLSGDLWAVDDARFMPRWAVARLAASAAVLGERGSAGFTAAQFRDATGLGRNHVIRLLEFLDRIGVTARRGEARIVRGDHAALVGAAEPWWAER